MLWIEFRNDGGGEKGWKLTRPVHAWARHAEIAGNW